MFIKDVSEYETMLCLSTEVTHFQRNVENKLFFWIVMCDDHKIDSEETQPIKLLDIACFYYYLGQMKSSTT